MNLHKIAVVVSLSLIAAIGLAQNKKQPANAAQKTIQWFFEKTYLHTDRDYYSSGEDIWFSAYLVNGKSASLTATSNNLYVELISPAAEIIDRKVIRLNGGLGNGDFKLKDSIPAGWYQLRAYTNWMRNFDDLFVFQKKIYVNSSLPKKTIPGLSKMPAAIKETAAATLAEAIHLFPEGGSLVEGLTSVVAFKAVDQYGDGIRVSGKVIATSGETIGAFESTDLGMGLFTVMPVAGMKYHVEGVFANGKKFSSELPEALSKGISLHVVTDSLNMKAVISVSEAMLTGLMNKDIQISVKHGIDVFYSGNIRISKPAVSVLIPLDSLPPGVARITVTDDQGRPNCERLVYIPGKPISLSVTPDKTIYKAQERVELTVKAVDQAGKPVKTYLSLAAVDAIAPASQSNIATYLLLQSEVKGKIQDAARYFDGKNSSRLRQLDLLLMTQGWRDYLWKKLADAKPVIKYMPEPGITISGKVRQKVGSKVLPGMNITLFGNELTGSKLFMTKSMEDGRYFLDGLSWFGEQTVKLSSKDEKGKKGGWITVDSLFKDPMKVNVPAAPQMKLPDLSLFETETARRMAFNRTAKVNEAVNLKEVVIDGGDKKSVRLRDEILMTFGYPDLVYNITSADHDYKGLEHFLLTKVPGAVSLSDTTDGIAFMVRGQRSAPRLIINQREDLFDRLDYYSLPMDQINKVTVRHLVRNGGEDAYVINLDLKETALKGNSLDILNTTLRGYDQARVFYNPPYQDQTGAKMDLRTTIFWAPLLKTNGAGEARISFLNADPKATIVIRAEGITETGMPVTGTAQYQVQ